MNFMSPSSMLKYNKDLVIVPLQREATHKNYHAKVCKKRGQMKSYVNNPKRNTHFCLLQIPETNWLHTYMELE